MVCPPFRTLVLVALLCGGTVPALGGGKEEVSAAGMSGTFVVCKEYGTVLGTYLADGRGKDLVRLNYLFGEDVNPRFSPVDDRILFTSSRGGTAGLWTTNRKGEAPKRLCDGDQGDWFPDGRRIAFRRQGRILSRSLQTGEESVVSPAGWTACSSPACSPDGHGILVLVHDAGKDAIWLVAAGEAPPKRLAEGETLGAPRWAPGGRRIVYQSEAHLWTMDADGTHARQLTTSGGIQRRPAWSPDGMTIAYCQGPSPKGPWQMAVASLDGTRCSDVPPGDARSVLCSDWAAETPGRKSEPTGMEVRPPPRLRLWQFDLPAAAPEDWAAFCRERKGWNAIPAEQAPPESLRGGCAIEGGEAVFLLMAGKTGAVLLPKTAAPCAIELAFVDPQGRETVPVESVRILRCGPDEVTLESISGGADTRLKATWKIGGSRALVHVAPTDDAVALRLSVPLAGMVLPDRFGNDLVADPQTRGEGRETLPWAPLLVGFLGNGSDLLVLVCPEQGRGSQVRKGKGPLFLGADVSLGKRGLSVGTITGERAWHLERFGAEAPADPLRFQWRMPRAAAWRLAVQGDGRRSATFFSDKESAFFDKKDVLFPKSAGFAARVGLGAIYLYGRTAATPPEALTPVDLLGDALGLKAADRALDEEGLTGYRRAARPTTWADMTVTLESLRYLFARRLEVQDREYAGHLCDDLAPFVEGMDVRLKEYADASRQIQALLPASDRAGAGAEKPREGWLAEAARKIADLGEKQHGLKSAGELAPPCTRIRRLAAQESGENLKAFEECCQGILAVAGPREEMLKAYRKLVVELRDAATGAVAAEAEGVEPAEKIRALCQGVLRNRFYAEADWRGEAYDVPRFWLGPRPYE